MFPIWAGGMLQTFGPWNPASAAGDGLLKAKTAITRIGRNRNAYTATAHAVNARLAVTRRLRTELLLFGGKQDVHDDEHRQRRHQPDRQGRAEWLVLGLVELVADEVPHELVVPAAQDVGDDVLAGHRDEHQQRPGDHAGEGQPQRDLAEPGERAG